MTGKMLERGESTGATSSQVTPSPAGERDDAAVLDGIAQRDRRALQAAYAQYGSRVHAVARALCGQARADALTREVFLQLWARPDLYQPARGTLCSCLLLETHRRAVDLVRGDGARGDSGSEHEPERPDADPSALVARADVEELVSALPDDERHPIVLAYFGGHTYSEIAKLLAVPEGIVKSRIRSGLVRLRSHGDATLDTM